MKREDYIVCSPSEMDDLLYDLYPDCIVSARVDSSKGFVYFWDDDNGRDVDFDETISKISRYLSKVVREPIEIEDVYTDSARNFTFLIKSEII